MSDKEKLEVVIVALKKIRDFEVAINKPGPPGISYAVADRALKEIEGCN